MPTLAEAARHLKPRHPVGSLPRLILMTDNVRLPDPMIAIQALPAGKRGHAARGGPEARAALADRVQPLCRRRGVRLLIANDWRLAARHCRRWCASLGGFGAAGFAPMEKQPPSRLDRHRCGAFAGGCPPGAEARRGCRPAVAGVRDEEPSGARTIGPLRFARWVARKPYSCVCAGRHRCEGGASLAETAASPASPRLRASAAVSVHVGFVRISESFDERLKNRQDVFEGVGVVAPAADRSSVDRLHDLVIARRRNGSCLGVLGVTEDGIVPRQIEKFEDAPGLARQVGNQILVADGEDRQRQHLADTAATRPITCA